MYIATIYLEDGEILFSKKGNVEDVLLKEIKEVISDKDMLIDIRTVKNSKTLRIVIEELCSECGKLDVITEFIEFCWSKKHLIKNYL